MFDLHLHTTLSDGELTPEGLLFQLKQKGVSPYSITDHNHALAYQKIDENKYPFLIPGTELTTSFQRRIVELLGYRIDPSIINQWYNNYYSEENLICIETKLFDRLKDICQKNRIKLSPGLKINKFEKGTSKKIIFYDIIKNNNNFLYKTYRSFFRESLSDPNNPFFLNEADTYPSFEESVSLIHQAGGIAFLAHPYEYETKKIDSLLTYCKENRIDGIECFHPSASMKTSLNLIDYCIENDLHASGGSDFHKSEKRIPIGVHTVTSIENLKCFEWMEVYK